MMKSKNERLFIEAQQEALNYITRRHFMQTCGMGLGSMALGSLFGGCFNGNPNTPLSNVGNEMVIDPINPLSPRLPHFAGRAKSVIYIHMAGAPSQLELFDYKPELLKMDGQDCPQSLLEGKRFAFIRGVPKMLAPQAEFKQHGQSGAWISNYLPHLQTVADEISLLKGVHTDQFNHAPAQLLMNTGGSRLGRPSMGAWVTYGLGSENANLPGFVVLTSGGKDPQYFKAFNVVPKVRLCCF
jgi:Protein of unknown function (DUF1501)